MDLAWDDLWTAIALMLIIEGIVLFIHPATVRQITQFLSYMDKNHIRLLGGFWMGLGVVALYWVRG